MRTMLWAFGWPTDGQKEKKHDNQLLININPTTQIAAYSREEKKIRLDGARKHSIKMLLRNWMEFLNLIPLSFDSFEIVIEIEIEYQPKKVFFLNRFDPWTVFHFYLLHLTLHFGIFSLLAFFLATRVFPPMRIVFLWK